MKFNKLPSTEIVLSKLALGTMTFGEQTSQKDSFKIMDFAFDQGINFIDTAEMYPIYPKKETYGLSEKIIGEWIKNKRLRNKIILGTKIASKNKAGIGATELKWIRKGGDKLLFDKSNLNEALDKSLKRLQTDYIDIYQLHWPERNVGMFGQLDYKYDPLEFWTPFEEILENLQRFIRLGKVRYIGVSNESAWGMQKFINLSDKFNLPKIITNQHCYNLLNRTYEIANSEISIRENCGLLAYSPLAGGRLTGKYLKNLKPKNSRFNLWPKKISENKTVRIDTAVSKYIKLAKKYDLKPSILSHAFILNKPFLSSSIVGATSVDNLKDAIKSLEINLNNELLEEIEEIHLSDPNPSI